MKKYILSAAVAALSMISCQKELADPIQPDQAPVAGELVEMTFSASVETDDTKTYIDAADGFKAFWEASDKIAVYADAQKTEQPFAVTEGSASGTFAYFRGTAPEGASAYYAVYPASAAGECADGKVSVTVPAVQTLSGHTTASGALVSVAKAEGDALAFKNVCALLKVKVAADDITEIVLQGKNDEVIAGTVTVDAATGVLSEVVEGSKMITFKPEGETFAQGDYYIALLPTAFTKGFDLVLSRAADSKRSIKETTKLLAIARSAGKNLGTVTAGYAYEWVNVIMNAAELTAFNAVSAATTNADVWVLGADIDYGSAKWAPVAFNGVFDGRNHRIYNIIVDSRPTEKSGYGSFFTQLATAEQPNAVVKNLIYGSSDGVNWDKVSSITFACVNAGNVNNGPNSFAALIGWCTQKSLVDGVVNFANVSVVEGDTSNNVIGGLTGQVSNSSTVQNCINRGNVTNNSSATQSHQPMGGIIGKMNSQSVILNCHNYGNIHNYNKRARFIGGICGLNGTKLSIKDCTNAGEVKCFSNTTEVTIEIGGIIGLFESKDGSVTGCTNTGEVSSVRGHINCVGGIIGTIKGIGTADNCTNDAPVSCTITGGTYHGVGGIVGFHNTSGAGFVTNCKNTSNGVITANLNYSNSTGCGIGGIIGINVVTTLTGNANEGSVTVNNTNSGPTYVGGVSGWNFNKAATKVSDNSNKASVTGTAKGKIYVGGVYGFNEKSSFSACSNTGEVSGSGGTDVKVGSVAGNNPHTITDCQAAGSVNGTTLDKDNYASYIQGTGSAGTATGCYFVK